MSRWNEYVCNKICGAASSVFILFDLLLILRIFSISFNIETGGTIKGTIWFLIVGFGLATARSLFKGYRLIRRGIKEEEEVIKLPADMFWTYFVNYPVILSLIYILGNFLRDYKNYPSYMCCAILFALGFFVDDIFHRPLDIFRP